MIIVTPGIPCMCMFRIDYVMNGMKKCLQHCQHKIYKIAKGSTTDNCKDLACVHMSDNPCNKGKLGQALALKVGAQVMVTMNVDVSDGSTHGAMGTVTNIEKDEATQEMNAILVLFDYENVEQEAKSMAIYEHVNPNAVPIEKNSGDICC